MSSSEHLALAESIKKVHQQLRREIKENPSDLVETIWNAHVENLEKLNVYAQSMRQLAEEHWAEKVHGQTRLTWCYENIREYFYGNGLKRKCERDKRKDIQTDICEYCQRRLQDGINKPRVLDVGSCYNAFSVYKDLDTIAIDIAPADESVHRIDILRGLQPPLLSSHSFDSIIFSLVLDYLPACRQRLSACLIAHELLTCLGLLLIIEPDSSLRGNREKLWRKALESIGFGLVSYTKVANLHCLAFRRMKSTCELNSDESERIAQLFNIPQDNVNDESEEEIEHEPISIDQDLFNELPYSSE